MGVYVREKEGTNKGGEGEEEESESESEREREREREKINCANTVTKKNSARNSYFTLKGQNYRLATSFVNKC